MGRLKNVWRGFVSVFADIGRGMSMISLYPHPDDYGPVFERDDAKALRADWEAVAGDLRKAIKEFEKHKSQ